MTRTLRALALCAVALPTFAAAGAAADVQVRAAGAPLPGRYGCTQSHWTGDGFEYLERGSVRLSASGSYTYVLGKAGRYGYNAASGRTTFHGGFLDRAFATAIDGKRTRLLLQFPKPNDVRWACSRRAA